MRQFNNRPRSLTNLKVCNSQTEKENDKYLRVEFTFLSHWSPKTTHLLRLAHISLLLLWLNGFNVIHLTSEIQNGVFPFREISQNMLYFPSSAPNEIFCATAYEEGSETRGHSDGEMFVFPVEIVDRLDSYNNVTGTTRKQPPNFYIFMQFPGKIGQIIGWRPLWG